MAAGSVFSYTSSNSCETNKAAGDTPAASVPAPPPAKKKSQSPQQTIDEFWSKFDSKTPGKATSILPKDRFAKQAGENAPKGTIEGSNPVSSYEEAVKICKEKVEKIVKECRRINVKYTDKHFDLEIDLKGWDAKKDCLSKLTASSDDNQWINFSPGSVKRVTDIFDNAQFFVDDATSNDIRQGRDGDCWFLAALCTLGNKEGLIEKICVARDEKVGVYGFVFHRDGEWISEIIDDKLYLTKPDYEDSWEERNLIDEDRQRVNSEEDYRKIYQTNSGALYFAQCEDPNETWLPLLEKAYAKAHGDFAAIEGGFPGEGLEDLTGGVTTEVFSTDILDKDYFWNEEILKVNKEFLFGCYSCTFRGGRGYRKGIYEGHAYSIMKAVEIDGKRLCLLRNPWGCGEWQGAWSDGSKEWTPEWMLKLDHKFGDDGAFWMEYSDMLRKYQTFDRTRLFTDEWKVTQQWTSLTVPWTVEYNKTKFCFSLEKKANVVLVLSQLDDRYFCGLEGQYYFELSFRVHKAGEEDYIVRSHSGYSMRRSVTADLELEAGEYHVLMKVEATRNTDAPAVEDVVRNNVKERRDKLLRIGFAYDLAHAKGEIKETEEEKIGRKNAEAVKKAKEQQEAKEKLLKEKKKRTHNENKEKRKERAAALRKKQKEKAKAEREKKRAAQKEVAEKENEKESKSHSKPSEGEKTKSDETAELKQSGDENTTTQESIEAESKPDESVTKPTVAEEGTVTAAADTSEATAATEKVTPRETIKSSGTTDESAKETTEKVKDVDAASTAPSDAGADAGSDSDSDFDDESDIVSVISDISSGVVEDAMEEEKLAAETAIRALPPPNPNDKDEFEKDPWNAVCVVGLRVYSRDSGVSVKVIRPRDWEHEEGKGEAKLDVDDSAADATKDVELKKEDPVAGETKKQEGSEGSGIMV